MVRATRGGKPLGGQGYVELTGYAAAVPAGKLKARDRAWSVRRQSDVRQAAVAVNAHPATIVTA